MGNQLIKKSDKTEAVGRAPVSKIDQEEIIERIFAEEFDKRSRLIPDYGRDAVQEMIEI